MTDGKRQAWTNAPKVEDLQAVLRAHIRGLIELSDAEIKALRDEIRVRFAVRDAQAILRQHLEDAP